MVKKIEGTLEDWDKLQLELAGIMRRIFHARAKATEAKSVPAAKEIEQRLEALHLEEDEIRKRIAGLSRRLHVELKNRLE